MAQTRVWDGCTIWIYIDLEKHFFSIYKQFKRWHDVVGIKLLYWKLKKRSDNFYWHWNSWRVGSRRLGDCSLQDYIYTSRCISIFLLPSYHHHLEQHTTRCTCTVNGHKYSPPSTLCYIFHIKPYFSKNLLWSHF